jgi:predicted flavoprotein YhiN
MMSADATLVDAHTHKVVWTSRGISGSQSYATVAQTVVTTSPTFLRQNLRAQDIAQLPDLQVAETQRASANQQMMQTLAQNLYASMSEGF